MAAVRDVSFAVRPGEVLGYLGPNASGKTTTVNMIIGLLEPTSGKVFYEGRDIQDDLVGFRRRLGYVPEEPNLYPFLSGREYLELAGRLRGMPDGLLARKIDGFLDLFSLAGAAEQSIGAYSKGMRQKVLISAALLHDPSLLVFDEPLSGLDVTTAIVFRHLVEALAAKGKVVLYSSHVLEAVEKICSAVVVLYQGRAVAHDSVARLRDLMALESLEAVFSELVHQADPAQTARDIVDVMERRS
ncbi:MAG: ABC transporter ATP-binding protein [Acidobacteria bacterium]|nr:MAG: ABC transporter ATP-binding protein [Acidobacteriota bacterium]